MKIIAKQNPTTVHFKDVNPGQVFIHGEDEVYMKLDLAYHTYDARGYEDATWSAVYLETGELCQFDNYEQVQLPIKIVPLEVTY